MNDGWKEIYDGLFKIAIDLVGDGKVYDRLPMTDVGYPFINFETSNWTPTPSKAGTVHTYSFTLNIWTSYRDLNSLTTMTHQIIEAANQLPNHILLLNYTNYNLLIDSTVTPNIRRSRIILTIR